MQKTKKLLELRNLLGSSCKLETSRGQRLFTFRYCNEQIFLPSSRLDFLLHARSMNTIEVVRPTASSAERLTTITLKPGITQNHIMVMGDRVN